MLSWIKRKSASFVTSVSTIFNFHEKTFLRTRVLRIDVLIYLRCGAMCFASGSIFGNKFLTPVGIKTLFPIFENSLCGKELAVETQTFEQRKYLPFSLWPNLLNMFFSFLEKKNLFFILLHGNILA